MDLPPGTGPLPAQDGCPCHLCYPADDLDAADQRCVDDVLRYGWHVLVVAAGEDQPQLAYTVGLLHRTGHPELLISGLDRDLMHRVLNTAAARVVAGRRLRAGDTVEGLLHGVPVAVDRLDDAVRDTTVTWSSWFHRAPVPAFQLVWPDTWGRFAWQPGSHDQLDELQPPAWRVPAERTGALAADPPWPLPVPPEQRAFLCRHVAEEGAAVLTVVREPGVVDGEDWSFHCGGPDHVAERDIVLEHVAHVVRSTPSLHELGDLGMDQVAWRVDADSPWVRAPAG